MSHKMVLKSATRDQLRQECLRLGLSGKGNHKALVNWLKNVRKNMAQQQTNSEKQSRVMKKEIAKARRQQKRDLWAMPAGDPVGGEEGSEEHREAAKVPRRPRALELKLPPPITTLQRQDSAHSVELADVTDETFRFDDSDLKSTQAQRTILGQVAMVTGLDPNVVRIVQEYCTGMSPATAAALFGYDMCKAATTGDIDAVKLYVKTHWADVDTRGNVLRRAMLHWAAYHGHVHVCSYLLEMGANPTLRDSQGAQPLHLAALSSHNEVVKLLIAVGIDVDATDRWGNTACAMAAAYNNDSVVASLLESGASSSASGETFPSVDSCAAENDVLRMAIVRVQLAQLDALGGMPLAPELRELVLKYYC